jgi:hypothetical protein
MPGGAKATKERIGILEVETSGVWKPRNPILYSSVVEENSDRPKDCKVPNRPVGPFRRRFQWESEEPFQLEGEN